MRRNGYSTIIDNTRNPEDEGSPAYFPTQPVSERNASSFSRSRFILGNNAQTKDNGAEDTSTGNLLDDAKNDLVVVGKKYPLHACPPTQIRSDDDICVTSGVLEEIIAIDVTSREFVTSDNAGDNKDTKRPIYNVDAVLSPTTSRREEIISLLTDVIWADCVTELRPLVERVVLLSREYNLTYADKNSSMVDGEGDGEGDGDFASLDAHMGVRKNSFDSDW